MTLDRTKKYKVGDVVFEWSGSCWLNGPHGCGIIQSTFEKMNPVEVEEPLKWSFEWGYPFDLNHLRHAIESGDYPRLYEGNWRHEVVSTRIG